jgi:glycerate kinase
MNTLVVVAPCSFKGSLDAHAVARAMARGVRAALPEAGVVILPVSDGGEGLLDVIIPSLGGEIRMAEVMGPDGTTTRPARWGWIAPRRSAVIETAEAAGLNLLPPEARNPLNTTTIGVGQLIRHALDHGAGEILVGLGGSATNDGGTGCASALGVRFLGREGSPVPRGGGSLIRISAIDASAADRRLESCRVRVACDVTNPLTGPGGATRVYSRQKGARPADMDLLEQGMEHYRALLRGFTGRDVGAEPGSGAAGGLGAALLGFCHATLEPGIETVLDAIGFDAVLHGADLVLTGEGRIDAQTAFGKAVAGVARRARAAGIPSAAVVGSVDGDTGALEKSLGLARIASLTGHKTSPAEAMERAAYLIEERTRETLHDVISSRAGG